MEEIGAKKGKFLLRRIEYTPDFANIYCDINIKWLQDIYFNSIIYMPTYLLGLSKFKKYHIFSNFISIDLEEWSQFTNKIILSFRIEGKYRNKIKKNVNNLLYSAENYVDKVYLNTFKENVLPTPYQVEKILKYFYQMDTFAIFNMFLPANYYDEILKEINMPEDMANVDYSLVCSFTPHRIKVREEKLKILLLYIKHDEKIEDEVKKYIINYAVFENFETLAFDDSIIKNEVFIKRQLKEMAEQYSMEEIKNELDQIHIKRNEQILNMNKFYNNLKISAKKIYSKEKTKKIIETFSYLILITSEEEKRHMIECKIFSIMSEVFKYMDIDISRNRLDKIIENYRKVWRK